MPVEARHGAQQEGVGHVPGEIVDTHGGGVHEGAEFAEEPAQYRRAAQNAQRQRQGAPEAAPGQGCHQRPGDAEELGEHEAVGHRLLSHATAESDQEEVGPDHALGEEVGEHGCQREAPEGGAQIHRIFFDLQVLFAGIRQVVEAPPATGAEEGEEEDHPRHSHGCEGSGHDPETQRPVGQHAHDQVAEVAIGMTGEADDGEGEGDQAAGAQAGQEAQHAEGERRGGQQGGEVPQREERDGSPQDPPPAVAVPAQGEPEGREGDAPDLRGGHVAAFLGGEAVGFHQALYEARLHDEHGGTDHAQVDAGQDRRHTVDVHGIAFARTHGGWVVLRWFGWACSVLPAPRDFHAPPFWASWGREGMFQPATVAMAWTVSEVVRSTCFVCNRGQHGRSGRRSLRTRRRAPSTSVCRNRIGVSR